MTRFMMSLEDSVNLVIHALMNGKNGEIFVQKSPGCKIKDLAKAIHIILNKKEKINIHLFLTTLLGNKVPSSHGGY